MSAMAARTSIAAANHHNQQVSPPDVAASSPPLYNKSEEDIGGSLSRRRTASNKADADVASLRPVPDLPWAQLSLGMKVRHFRNQTWLLFDDPHSSKYAMGLTLWIFVLIAMGTVTFCLESLPQYQADAEANNPKPIWFILESFAVIQFTVEFLARLLSTPDVRKFCTGLLNVIDLLAILPYYIEVAASGGGVGGLGVIRVVRLARVFRVFKLSKYSSGFKLVGKALSLSMDALGLMLFLIGIAVVVFSSAMFFAEQSIMSFNVEALRWEYTEGYECQSYDEASSSWIPDTCHEAGAFQSIPDAFWWAIVTMTTVGYGDVYPNSDVGRLVATFTMLTGILVVAFPITIIGTNFSDLWEENKAEKEREKALLSKTELVGAPGAAAQMALPPGLRREIMAMIKTNDAMRDQVSALTKQLEASDARITAMISASATPVPTVSLSRTPSRTSKSSARVRNESQIRSDAGELIELKAVSSEHLADDPDLPRSEAPSTLEESTPDDASPLNEQL